MDDGTAPHSKIGLHTVQEEIKRIVNWSQRTVLIVEKGLTIFLPATVKNSGDILEDLSFASEWFHSI